jgi:hypothetical protein
MSKSRLAQALVLGALLAATNLVSLAGVAHAKGAAGSVVGQDDRRLPTQGQVGESWHQRPAATNQPAIAGDTRRPPTEGQVGEPWHPRVNVPTPPAEPDSQPSWPIASLAVLATALALSAGLVAKRLSRRTRIGHAA